MVSDVTIELYKKFIRGKIPLRIKSIKGDPNPFVDKIGNMTSEANGILRHIYQNNPICTELPKKSKTPTAFKLLEIAGIELPIPEKTYYVRILYEIDRVENRYSTLEVPMDWVEMVEI